MAAQHPKTFAYDAGVLDPEIATHISSLYAAVDNGEHVAWGAHFTEDAELKKGTTNVKGRETLVDLITKSWSEFKSRDHTVYSVFPFGPKAEEVMLHGRSNNVSVTGEESTFTWAARMHFRRSEDDNVLIDKYTIIVDPYPSTL
ncbi:hypothetical protein GMORB2_6508 [Geosmithia morbida]|uniref:SnoaL-like domain-containing protein n=1 Tax=Geosmithia morbida TaxID=1094350 RepID=A0A9P5D4N2_9HYPO|nr:uncharacterized protein GMORB2_6508 [Geosmithia morbida]KAF4122960.1 hypothetical protein GMORB2_6508 [Geosmithia morbida]